jgi:quercetin dioxygenase-like cupin family protein
LGESDTSSLLSQQLMEEGNDQPALSAQETERMSDIYVQSNVWAAGGSTGWHSHPGHSVIIVTAGTVTKCMYTKQG